MVGAEAPKAEISAAYSVVVLAVVLLNALLRLPEELEVTVSDAANPSAFAVLELDELRRHAHRRHADDDIQTSPLADDRSDPEHGRTRTPRAHNPQHRQPDRPRRSLDSHRREHRDRAVRF